MSASAVMSCSTTGLTDGGARIGRDLSVEIADLGAAFGRMQVIAEHLPRDRHPQGREIHPFLDARHIPVLDGLCEIIERREGRHHEDRPGDEQHEEDTKRPTHMDAPIASGRIGKRSGSPALRTTKKGDLGIALFQAVARRPISRGRGRGS